MSTDDVMWGDSDDEEYLLAGAEDAEKSLMVETVEVKDKVMISHLNWILIVFLKSE